ncbi:MAG: hypothetical protein N2486_06575 [Caloramator sp.]|nr:hypothetical protein [Caloramator sp.]
MVIEVSAYILLLKLVIILKKGGMKEKIINLLVIIKNTLKLFKTPKFKGR